MSITISKTVQGPKNLWNEMICMLKIGVFLVSCCLSLAPKVWGDACTDFTSAPNATGLCNSIPAPNNPPINNQDLGSLFTETQTRIINLVLRARPRNSLSPEEQSAIRRIETIQLIPAKEVANAPACQGEPNAFYDPMTHRFGICPRMGSYSPDFLAGVIAHELAHAIDPCNMQFPLYALTLNQLPGGASKLSTEVDRLIRSGSNPSPRYSAIPCDLIDPASRPCGELLNPPPVIAEESGAVSYDKFPFPGILQCLDANGFRFSRLEDETVAIRAAAAAITASGTPLPSNFQDSMNRILAHPQCLQVGPVTNAREAFSDWVAAEILGQRVTERPTAFTTPQAKAGLFGIFLENVCAMTSLPPRTTSASQAVNMARVALAMSTEVNHPVDRKRLQDSFMLQPNIRAMLGCGPPQRDKTYCSDPTSTKPIGGNEQRHTIGPQALLEVRPGLATVQQAQGQSPGGSPSSGVLY